jgi:hypothetical protein
MEYYSHIHTSTGNPFSISLPNERVTGVGTCGTQTFNVKQSSDTRYGTGVLWGHEGPKELAWMTAWLRLCGAVIGRGGRNRRSPVGGCA